MRKAIRDKNGKFINRRKRQMIFRRILLFGIVLCFSSLIAVLSSKLFVNAGSVDDEHLYKYYTSIDISYGDTLCSIADEYAYGFDSSKEFIDEVMFTNHMLDDSIVAGQSLIIPYYSTELK